MTQTVLALRHLAFEDLGAMAPYFAQRGYRIDYVDIGVDALPADAAAADVMVVLGGPIGAHDDALYPYLAGEVDLIARRLQARRPLLGVCLGAQLMARALGAAVQPMPAKEIGFGPVALTPAGQASPLRWLADQPVLHWHGDAFAVPAQGTLLAGTAACAHQAFAVGAQALALQFHLEADLARIEQWLIGHTLELAQAQADWPLLRAQARQHQHRLPQVMAQVLDDWLAQAASANGTSANGPCGNTALGSAAPSNSAPIAHNSPSRASPASASSVSTSSVSASRARP